MKKNKFFTLNNFYAFLTFLCLSTFYLQPGFAQEVCTVTECNCELTITLTNNTAFNWSGNFGESDPTGMTVPPGQCLALEVGAGKQVVYTVLVDGNTPNFEPLFTLISSTGGVTIGATISGCGIFEQVTIGPPHATFHQFNVEEGCGVEPPVCGDSECTCEMIITVTNAGSSGWTGGIGQLGFGQCLGLAAGPGQTSTYTLTADAVTAGDSPIYELIGFANGSDVTVHITGCGVDITVTPPTTEFFLFEVNEGCVCEAPAPQLVSVDCINDFGFGFVEYYAEWRFEDNGTAEPCGGVKLIEKATGYTLGSFNLISSQLLNGEYIFEGTFALTSQYELHDVCWEVAFCDVISGDDCGTQRICPSDFFPAGCPCSIETQCDPYSGMDISVECQSAPSYYPYLVSATIEIPVSGAPNGCPFTVVLQSFSGESSIEAETAYTSGGSVTTGIVLPFNDQGYVNVLCLEVDLIPQSACGQNYGCSFVQCFDIGEEECEGGNNLIGNPTKPGFISPKTGKFRAFPNPANDMVILNNLNPSSIKFRLLNVEGKEIQHGRLQGFSSFEVNTSELSEGVYYFEVTDFYTKELLETRKLVVAR